MGRKHNLAPKTEAEEIRVDLIETEANDMRDNWVNLCYYSKDFVSQSKIQVLITLTNSKKQIQTKEKCKPEYLNHFNRKLQDVSRFLGSRDFFAGDYVKYDFLF